MLIIVYVDIKLIGMLQFTRGHWQVMTCMHRRNEIAPKRSSDNGVLYYIDMTLVTKIYQILTRPIRICGSHKGKYES